MGYLASPHRIKRYNIRSLLTWFLLYLFPLVIMILLFPSPHDHHHVTFAQVCESDASMRPLELTDELAVLAGDAIDLRIPFNRTTYYLQPLLSNTANYNPCIPIPLSTTTAPSKFTQFIVIPVAVMDPQLTNIAYDANLQQDPTLPSSYYSTPVTTRPTLISTTQLIHATSGRLLGTTRCMGSYTPCQPHQPVLLPSSFNGEECQLSLQDFETIWDLDQHNIPSSVLLSKLMASYQPTTLGNSNDDTNNNNNNNNSSNGQNDRNEMMKSVGNNSTMDFPHYSHLGEKIVSHDGFRPFNFAYTDNDDNNNDADNNFNYFPIKKSIKMKTKDVQSPHIHTNESNTQQQPEQPSYFQSYYAHLNNSHQSTNDQADISSHHHTQTLNSGDELGDLTRQHMNNNNNIHNNDNNNNSSTSTSFGYIHKTGPYSSPSNIWVAQQQSFIAHINSIKSSPESSRRSRRESLVKRFIQLVQPDVLGTNNTNNNNNNNNNDNTTMRSQSKPPTLLLINTPRSNHCSPTTSSHTTTPPLKPPQSINPTSFSIFNVLNVVDHNLKSHYDSIIIMDKHHNLQTFQSSSSTTIPSSTLPSVDVGSYVGNFQSAPSLFTDMLNGDISAIPMLGNSDDSNPLNAIARMSNQQIAGIFGDIPSLGLNSGISPPSDLLGSNGLSGPVSPQSIVEQLQIDKFNTAQRMNLERQMFINPTVTNMQQNNQNPGTQTSQGDGKEKHTAFVTLRTRPQSTITSSTQALVTPCRGYVRAQTMIELDPLNERSRYGAAQGNGVKLTPQENEKFVLFGGKEMGKTISDEDTIVILDDEDNDDDNGAIVVSDDDLTILMVNDRIKDRNNDDSGTSLVNCYSNGLASRYHAQMSMNTTTHSHNKSSSSSPSPSVLITLQLYDIIHDDIWNYHKTSSLLHLPPQLLTIQLLTSPTSLSTIIPSLITNLTDSQINLLNNLQTTIDLALGENDDLSLGSNITPNLHLHLNATLHYLIPIIYSTRKALYSSTSTPLQSISQHYKEVIILNPLLDLIGFLFTNIITHQPERLLPITNSLQSATTTTTSVHRNGFRTKSNHQEQLHKHMILTRLNGRGSEEDDTIQQHGEGGDTLLSSSQTSTQPPELDHSQVDEKIDSILDQIYNNENGSIHHPNKPKQQSLNKDHRKKSQTEKQNKNKKKRGGKNHHKDRNEDELAKVPITFTGEFNLNNLYSNGRSVVSDIQRYHESVQDVEDLKKRFYNEHIELTKDYFRHHQQKKQQNSSLTTSINQIKTHNDHSINNNSQDDQIFENNYEDLDFISPPRQPSATIDVNNNNENSSINYPDNGFVDRKVEGSTSSRSLHQQNHPYHNLNHYINHHPNIQPQELHYQINHLLTMINSNIYAYLSHDHKNNHPLTHNNLHSHPFTSQFSTLQSSETPSNIDPQSSGGLKTALMQSCTLTIETRSLLPICLPSTSTYPSPINITQTIDSASFNLNITKNTTIQSGDINDPILRTEGMEEGGGDTNPLIIDNNNSPSSLLLSNPINYNKPPSNNTIINDVVDSSIPNPTQQHTTLSFSNIPHKKKSTHSSFSSLKSHPKMSKLTSTRPFSNPYTRTFVPLQIFDDIDNDPNWNGNNNNNNNGGAMEIINDPNFPPLLNTGDFNLDNDFITQPLQPITGSDAFQSELQSNTFQQPLFGLSKASGGGVKGISCKGCSKDAGLTTPMNNNFWVSESMSNLEYSMDYATLNTYPFVIGQQIIRNYGPSEQFTAIRAAKRIFMSFTFRFGIGVTLVFGFAPVGFPKVTISPLAAVVNAIIQPIANILQGLPLPALPTINPNTSIQFKAFNLKIKLEWGIQRLITEDHEVVVSVILASSPGMALVSRLVAHIGRTSVPFDLAVTRRVYVPAGVYGSTDGALIEYDYRVPGVYEGANLGNLEYIADIT